MLRALRALAASSMLVTLLAVAPMPTAGAVLPAGPGASTAAPRLATQGTDDLAARIDRLPHVVSVVERPAGLDGYRRFVVGFRQPVDHAHPRGATFVQRVVVMHRGTDRPTVMETEGYAVEVAPYILAEPTSLLDANQVAVEHRFFGPSRPSRPDWARQLTIRQAAADHHRVVTSFKRLYQRRWIATGVSKGGMTATYFRRFYPRDVFATVAYVAPNDVVDADDRYNAFLERVGTASCRDAIVAVQRRTLGADRAWFLRRTRQAATDQGLTWRIVGDPEKAFESAVIEAFFQFWQYQSTSTCRYVPDADASRRAVWNWYEDVSPLTQFADQRFTRYVSYFYQAAAQLGAPEPYETRLTDLLRYPGADVPTTFVPQDLQPIDHDTTAMPDVDRWVRTRSTRMLFVYGSDDPWSAEPFYCGATSVQRDCHRMVVAGGNHGARLGLLPPRKRYTAVTRLERWAGVRHSIS